MWAIIDSISGEGIDRKAEITIFEGYHEEVGRLEVPVFQLQIFCGIKGAVRVGDYLAFNVGRGFGRYTRNIVHGEHDGDPEERHQRCALCGRSLRSKGKYRWSLYFGDHSGDAYHRGCLKKL